MQFRKDNINNSWDLLIGLISFLVLGIMCFFIYLPLAPTIESYLNRPKYDQEELNRRTSARLSYHNDDWDRVSNGIHVKTGMIYDQNFKYIKAHCLACHSSKLITQNKADRAGWKSMIKWMQSTQGLHDLGADEPYVLDYLSKNYAPKEMGRRPNIDMEEIEWYVLDLNED